MKTDFTAIHTAQARLAEINVKDRQVEVRPRRLDWPGRG